MAFETVMFRVGKYMQPGELEFDGDKINIKAPFHLKDDVKALAGARWLGYDNPPRKVWQVDNNEHNRFQLDFLLGKKPYALYDKPLVEFTPKRTLYQHQIDMVRHALTRHYCIFACEMGTGKTLAAIEIMEYVKEKEFINDIWYVAPKSALAAVQLEFYKWGCPIRPKFLTYEALVREMKNWTNGLPAPQMVFFDESSKIKTPTAQRTQAAFALATGIRTDWGDKGYVILMSGSPAPKSPTDWWSQCQAARPGFLKEGNVHKFQARLAITKQEEGSDGVKYPKILGWKDSNKKCQVCGEKEDAFAHMQEAILMGQGHKYEACQNEIELLSKRMGGLVLIKFKRDCLDLPQKVYRRIKCKPDIATLNAARLIQRTSTRAVDAMMRMRELSDGFQYEEEVEGNETCPRCQGNRVTPNTNDACYACNGNGVILKFKRKVIEMSCPKDQAFLDLLDEHEDCGRFVCFGGFTATVDRIERLVKSAGWEHITVDGRGWRTSLPADNNVDMLRLFQDLQDGNRKIVFDGHPGSAGMGLTLTASPTICYYSNDFNAESRIQSEDRIHRPGSRGANIVDLIHLPTDTLVIENLFRKRELQSMSLGEIADALKDTNE